MKNILLIVIPSFLILNNLSYSQWNYGQPFSTSAPSNTWQQVQNKVPITDNFMMDSLTKPYPTNAWFNHFFLYQKAYPYPGGQGLLSGNKTWVYPYLVGIGYDYASFSNKFSLLAINYKPFQDTIISGQYPTVIWDNGSFIYLGTTESASSTIRPVVLNDYTELSVTIKYIDTTNTSKYYKAPIVRGMPYVTMIYNNMTPVVHTPLNAVGMINNTIAIPDSQFTGSVFKLNTTGTTGAFRPQTWMIYSSSNITFTVMPGAVGLQGPDNFTGYIRLAHVTYDGDPNAQDTTARINLLNSYYKYVPVKGSYSSTINSSSQTAAVNFNFTRYNESSLGNDSLLMMALPHHIDMNPSNQVTNTLKYQVIKGTMSEIHGKTWNLSEQLAGYSWYPKYGDLSTVPVQWRDTIQKFVNQDYIGLFNRQYQWKDIYSAGKSLARMGRVILIADELYETDSTRYAVMGPLAQTMRDSLKLYLGPWLNGNSTSLPNVPPVEKDSLMYDTKFGGLVSSRSWDSLHLTNGIDFGSALYNDHHFHYGYIIYAAASIAKKDQQWFTSNGNYYLNRAIDLIRDYGNPSRSDNYFALQRYKDVYDGNSWANGLVPYGAGKNQESSSEAVNAWYGMYLFGHAIGNQNIMNTGRHFLAQEIRTAKKYYHIRLPQINPIYPTQYTSKYHNVVNLYNGEIDAHNFFLTVNYTNTGIHVLPITPATEQLWYKDYATDMYDYTPNGLRHTPCFDPNNVSTIVWNWTTINVGIQATAYPDTALNFFPYYGYDIFKYDNGSSPSNVIYWILTRKYGTPIGIRPISNELPSSFKLYQNYPNPFNPKTKIKMEIAKLGNVKLVVYDILGQEVAQLVNEKLKPGTYEVTFDGSNYSSGVYFYQLTADGYSETKSMVLLK